MMIKSPLSKPAVKPNVRKKKGAPSNGSATKERVSKTSSGNHFIYETKKGRNRADIPTAPKLKNALTAGRIILWSLILGVCGYLYITHVFTTQAILQEVSQTQREYDRVRLIYEDRKLTHDRLTGPPLIYSRARQSGFIESGPADYVIQLNQ